MSGFKVGAVTRETGAVLREHGGVFLTLAAALMFLPMLAVGLATPAQIAGAPPVPGPRWLPLLQIAQSLLTILGTLAIAAVAGDAARGGGATVGAILARMTGPALRYFGATVLLGLAVVLVFAGLAALLVLSTGVPFGEVLAASASNDPAQVRALFAGRAHGGGAVAVALAILAALLGVIYVGLRLAVMPGVFALERVGVIAGVRRAWALSRGSMGKLFGVLALAVMLALPTVLLVGALGLAVGSVAQIAGTREAGRLAQAVLQAALGAGLTVVVAAWIGVLYRHLAGRWATNARLVAGS